MARLHAIVGELAGDGADDVEVGWGSRPTGARGCERWSRLGTRCWRSTPFQAARFHDRLGVSGAKSDAGGAHVLADLVRTHAHELRPVAVIDHLRDRFEVEPVCRVLDLCPGTYYGRKRRPPSARARRDAVLIEQIKSIRTTACMALTASTDNCAVRACRWRGAPWSG